MFVCRSFPAPHNHASRRPPITCSADLTQGAAQATINEHDGPHPNPSSTAPPSTTLAPPPPPEFRARSLFVRSREFVWKYRAAFFFAFFACLVFAYCLAAAVRSNLPIVVPSEPHNNISITTAAPPVEATPLVTKATADTMALNSSGGATSVARVYADVNANMPRSYWDYDSVNISWGVLENYEVVRKIGLHYPEPCEVTLR